MAFSTSTTFHLNVIININIISSQCHFQHQYHLISMTLLTSSDRGLSKEEEFGLGGLNMDGPIT